MDITIRNLQKKYSKNKVVLGDINLSAHSGECIGILGSNGCGKTTLLSILAGVLRPDSGEFLLNDMNIFKNRNTIGRIIGYVPQGNPLMEDLSGKDNLKLWYTGSSLNLNQELEQGVLKMLGIDEFLNMRVSHMSGGMKKRLSIGCSVADNPKILILDEPGASLDLECKALICDYLNAFKKKGGIILITTHEEQEIKLCDRTYILKDGLLVPHKYTTIKDLVSKL